MARKGEPDLTNLFLMAGAGGAFVTAGMMVASKGIGAAVGNAIASGINAKRTRDWQAAIYARVGEAEKLLAMFELIGRDFADRPELLADIVKDRVELSFELENAQNAATVFEAYDNLVALISRIKNRLSHHQMLWDILFDPA